MTVVLSPHLDDAVLSCWHVLERPGTLVVNVFTGSPPPGTPPPAWDRLTGASDSVERMHARHAEDRRALDRAGCDAVQLGLLDAQYRDDDRAPPELAERLRPLLVPGTVYAPAGLGGHPDHVAVRDAALRLRSRGWTLVLYADLPHGIRQGWPGWVSGEPTTAGGGTWDAVLATAGLDPLRLVPRVRPLDADTRARKLRAIDEYRSQRAALDDMTFVALDDPRALAFEVSWTVPPSAGGGVPEPVGEVRVPDAVGEAPGDGR